MRPFGYVLVVVAIISAVICTRLGFWQLSRLHHRRIENAQILTRLDMPAVPVRDLPRDTAAARFRIGEVTGVADYAHQITLTNRTRNGSPGVNILTPVRLQGSDTAVLVNRGWIYSPDGMTADLAPWQEKDSVQISGYAVPFGPVLRDAPRSPTRPTSYRWITQDVVRESIPYPLLPFIIIQRSDTIPSDHVPPRVVMPSLDEGPHRSYAIQWFCFALIAVLGIIFFIRAGKIRA